MSRWERLRRRVSEPVDVASLAAFRVAFGLLMLYEVWRFFARGWIEWHYVLPSLLFPYPGFEWVVPWPGRGMALHFAALGVLAVGIAVGLAFRLCALLFAAGFAYVFLLDQARYLNHFYLIVLLCVLLALSPAHRAFSFDASLRPALRSDRVAAWSLWLLRAQLALVYVFAAVAKCNADWLSGLPMRIWLLERAQSSAWAPLLEQPGLALAMSWGGLLFDLAIAPALLWRRTRAAAFAAAVGFHGINGYLFQIGIFPALGIAATTLFLDPGWPRRLARLPGAARTAPAALRPIGSAAAALAAGYLVLQLALPLRHWAYPSSVRWTEQGQSFSWRMKLTDKDGRCRFWVEDRGTLERWIVDPRDHLMPWQYSELCGRPEMIRIFATHLGEMLREARPSADPAVGVLGRVSMNGRTPEPLVDPEADLLRAPPFRALDASWLLPLHEPRPDLHSTRFGFAAEEDGAPVPIAGL